eukprot:scaffold1239_cov175-Pinguiococcus_pyrenoidosus.AAC.22
MAHGVAAHLLFKKDVRTSLSMLRFPHEKTRLTSFAPEAFEDGISPRREDPEVLALLPHQQLRQVRG